MSSQKGAVYMIAISLFFAGAMIYFANYVELESSNTVMYILMSTWFVLFSLIQQRSKKWKLEISNKSFENSNA